MVSLGFLGIPVIALLAYLNYNDKMSANSFVLLVISIVASDVIFLGFVIALRRKILNFYTRKIKKILLDINNQNYISRNLYWEVSDQCMQIKLNEINLNEEEDKNDFSTF